MIWEAHTDPAMHTILRLPAVKAAIGLARSTLYLRVEKGTFPKPVNLGARAVGWPAREVYAINAARIAGKSDREIRSLVDSIHDARKVLE